MEKIKEENNENFDKIKVFSSEDEKLKVLGELLSNKSSRDIIRLLIENEMYTNEIAKKLELKVNLVIHHLQKMESIGLVEISNKKIIRKGEEHRFFRIPSGMLIFPDKTKDETNGGLLKKIFKEGVKFASVVIAGVITWIGTQNIQNNKVDSPPIQPDLNINGEVITNVTIENQIQVDIVWSTIFTILVISIGLIFIFIKKRKKGLIKS